jgi:hypothetical protein
VGEGLADGVGVDESRDVDHPVVHLPSLGAPRDVGDQSGEHLVGDGQPVAPAVDPGAVGEGGPLGVVEPGHPGDAGVEECALEVHGAQNTAKSNIGSMFLTWTFGFGCDAVWLNRQWKANASHRNCNDIGCPARIS